jgi:hypothetical protein
LPDSAKKNLGPPVKSELHVVHACNLNFSGARSQEDCEFKAIPGKTIKTLSSKQNTNKSALVLAVA